MIKYITLYFNICLSILLFISCEKDEENNTCGNISFDYTLEKETESSTDMQGVFEILEESFTNASFTWKINDETISSIEQIASYTFTTNGSYTVCVFTETPECPNGISYCVDFEITTLSDIPIGGKKACTEFDILKNSISNDNMTYSFHVKNPKSSSYDWYIDEVLFIGGHPNNDTSKLNYRFTDDGTYSVCAVNTDNECQSAVEKCMSVTIETPKGLAIDFIKESYDASLEDYFCPKFKTSYSQNINKLTFKAQLDTGDVPSNLNYDLSTYKIYWTVNDIFTGFSGNSFIYEFEEAGTYTICSAVETPDCPYGATYCYEFIVAE